MARLPYLAALILAGLIAGGGLPRVAPGVATPSSTPSVAGTIAPAARTTEPTPTPALAPSPVAGTIATAPRITEPTPAPALAPSPAATLTGRDVMGARILIPRLGIDLPLAWGDIGRDVPREAYPGATPEGVALVFPGSALPAAGGNTYVYSHARVGMFLSLWNVRIDDVVLLRWTDLELRYRITRVELRVDPADVSWLDPAGPERLTLQTSTGPYASDPRFIAVARPIDHSE